MGEIILIHEICSEPLTEKQLTAVKNHIFVNYLIFLCVECGHTFYSMCILRNMFHSECSLIFVYTGICTQWRDLQLTHQSNVVFATFRIHFSYQSRVKGLIMPLLSQKPSYVHQFKSNRLNKENWGPHSGNWQTNVQSQSFWCWNRN